MRAEHSSANDSWQTPPEICQAVRGVLEGIDLDPCSTAEANRVVCAKYFWSKEQDGLARVWKFQTPTSIFCNPPSGKMKSRGKTKSKPTLFWDSLIECKELGSLSHAIFLGFSIEFLQTSQNSEGGSATRFPFCVPKNRIKFVHPDGTQKHSPTHSNVIVYVPGTFNNTVGFVRAFQDIGSVVCPARVNLGPQSPFDSDYLLLRS